MVTKKSAGRETRVCDETVWQVILKARALSDDYADEEEETDDLLGYILGAAVDAVREWAFKHGIVLSREKALVAVMLLVELEKSGVFKGEVDPKVLTEAEWENRCKALAGIYIP